MGIQQKPYCRHKHYSQRASKLRRSPKLGNYDFRLAIHSGVLQEPEGCGAPPRGIQMVYRVDQILTN